jgi:hypothetical protein
MGRDEGASSAIGVAAGTKLPARTREREQVRVRARIAADTREPVVERAAGEELVRDLGDDGAPWAMRAPGPGSAEHTPDSAADRQRSFAGGAVSTQRPRGAGLDACCCRADRPGASAGLRSAISHRRRSSARDPNRGERCGLADTRDPSRRGGTRPTRRAARPPVAAAPALRAALQRRRSLTQRDGRGACRR